MKNKILIALLAVLLAFTFGFVSCDNGELPGTEKVPYESHEADDDGYSLSDLANDVVIDVPEGPDEIPWETIEAMWSMIMMAWQIQGGEYFEFTKDMSKWPTGFAEWIQAWGESQGE